ncbi:MAG: hypothetical protein DIU71_13130 [Proteobacteria bacterium]|nr:MAG: hypothetical protein DIU71_13130 [Pseudomonadota bacterium]
MNDYLTIADIIDIARGRRWLIAAGVALFLALALAGSFLMTPIYRAQALLVPANTSSSLGGSSGSSMLGQLGGLASLAGVLLPSDAETDEALALLKSRELTQAFIEENDLMPVLFHKKWNAETGEWRVTGDKVPTLWDAYKYFNRKVRKVYQDKATGHVTLQIEWRDPQVAADWANELANRVNLAMRQRAIDEAARSIRQLNVELAKTQVVSLQQAIAQLVQTQIERQTIAEVREEFAFRILDRAAPPDLDDYERPKPVLYAAVGMFMGFVAGLSLAVMLDRRRVLDAKRRLPEPVVA